MIFIQLRPKFIRKLEEDARTQARFHLSMAWFWLINVPIVTYLFVYQEHIWTKYGVFYILIASLYANFATDFGALSAAQASQKGDTNITINTVEDLDINTSQSASDIVVL
jgi:hypothetical protein